MATATAEPGRSGVSTTTTIRASAFCALFVLSVTTTVWFALVSGTVTAPYLDEVFHVRQALTYWNGSWRTWDPKITTPPGLYVLSWFWLYGHELLLKLVASLPPQLQPSRVASLNVLRSLNVFGLIAIFGTSRLLAFEAQRDARRAEQQTRDDASEGDSPRAPAIVDEEAYNIDHVALNICLFPPLFFFSGLYYTDVISVLSVLLAHLAFRRRKPVLVASLGLVALTLRQTNIFWVAIYLGGQELLRQLKKGTRGLQFSLRPSFLEVLHVSWSRSVIDDPPIQQAWFEDYLRTCMSVVTGALTDLPALLVPLTPCLGLLSAFAIFVVVNGGVVLGDKANHIASLHVPQMLYVWPYITFFSWPILLPAIIPRLLESLLGSFPGILPQKTTARICRTLSIDQWPSVEHGGLPRLLVVVPVLALVLAAVHFNTLVHPFTLADNRHFVFYVFRILLRYRAGKYVAAPLYIALAWACILALAPPKVFKGIEEWIVPKEVENNTADYSSKAKRINVRKSTRSKKKKPEVAEEASSQAQSSIEAQRQKTSHSRSHLPAGAAAAAAAAVGPRASFVLLWLATCTPSLATAPLVEPRYFILPWIVWRLNVPSVPSSGGRLVLWIESFWMLTINVVVGWLFLHREFQWPQEPGAAQRFMW